MQTNRTILFQKVNDSVPSIVTMVGENNGTISLDDDKIKQIHRQLEVHSAMEYLEKFQPVMYQYLNMETHQIQYTEERQQGNTGEEKRIVFDDKNFLITLLLDRIGEREQGCYQMDCFQTLRSYIWKDHNEDLFEKVRMELKDIWMAQRCGSHLAYEQREEELIKVLQEKYNDGIYLLQYYIHNFPKCFAGKKEMISNRMELESFEHCQVERIGRCFRKTEEMVLDWETASQYEKYIDTKLDQSGILQKKLLAKCLMGPVDFNGYQKERAVEEYNMYAEFYGRAVEQFLETAVPILEKFLNVYFFFRQYEKKEDTPALVVTNCDIELLENPKYEDRLKLYLETVNEKKYYDYTIWQGILPGISIFREKKAHITRERFRGNSAKTEVEADKIHRINRIVKLMEHYRVQTFISSSDREEATFSALMDEGARRFEDGFGCLAEMKGSRFLSPCYPDFTIIPKEHGCIRLARRADIKDDGKVVLLEEGSIQVRFDGIYIEAAFVAAGVMGQSKVTKDGNHDAVSVMPKEVGDFPKDLKEEMEKAGSGVTFVFDTGYGKNSYAKVLTDRTLAVWMGKADTVSSVKSETLQIRNL